jgi:flagellar hook-length control protein FliK
VSADGSGDGGAAANQVPIGQTPAFALALAALATSGLETSTQAQPSPDENAVAAASGEAALRLVLNDPAAATKGQDLAMPSDADPLAETLSLLGLSEDDAAEVQASASETTAKVVSQETHLAASQKAPTTLGALAAEIAQAGASTNGTKVVGEVPAGAKAQGEGEANVAGVPSQHAAVPTAAAAEDGMEGSSGQERRQAEGGATQQNASGAQNAMPGSTTAGNTAAARGSAEATFQSYTDDLSPGSQVARSVTAEIASRDRTGAGQDGVLKVLHIELKPQNLGTVSVRMSLKDDVISLHMETSRHETAAAIEKERSALTSALKSAGYVVDEITTQMADPVRANGRIEAATNDASMSSFAQGENQSRSQAQQDTSSGRGQGGQRGTGDDVSLTSSNASGDAADGVSRQRSSDIYV